jgi:hypothetical protein
MKLPLMGGVGPAAETSSHLTPPSSGESGANSVRTSVATILESATAADSLAVQPGEHRTSLREVLHPQIGRPLCRVFAFAGDTWPERVIAADLLHKELGAGGVHLVAEASEPIGVCASTPIRARPASPSWRSRQRRGKTTCARSDWFDSCCRTRCAFTIAQDGRRGDPWPHNHAESGECRLYTQPHRCGLMPRRLFGFIECRPAPHAP